MSTRMLRHYDALGLVRPTGRTHGGYREYSDADVRRIFHVESLRTLGLSLRQIARALEDPEFAPAELVAELIRWTEERLERERELLDRLRTIDASEPTDWPDVLRLVELVRGLGSTNAARRQQAVLTGPENARAPAELLAAAVLAETDPHVAGALRWALARAGGQGAAELIEGVRADDAGVRRRAVLALAELPTSPDVAAALAVALNDPEPAVRRCAALQLAAPGATEAVPTLIEMVVEGDNDVGAAEALGSVAADGHCTHEVVAALSDELAEPTAGSATRIRLAQALVELASGTTEADRTEIGAAGSDADAGSGSGSGSGAQVGVGADGGAALHGDSGGTASTGGESGPGPGARTDAVAGKGATVTSHAVCAVMERLARDEDGDVARVATAFLKMLDGSGR
ncbi:HEAT repeat domain-containing protein [Streptomyces sp. XM4193]|nr:HEAT repeat domain-containing protein [Streptomyces sp. XM4193]